ncbi:MAG TPA: MEDS domain-containing protein [Puia sp.]|nr:MEDS domain-containing protein [Puia sp.]
MYTNSKADWKRARTDNFWGEIAPCEHVVQIYEQDDVFLDALAGFVYAGLETGDCVIVIATKAHLNALTASLGGRGVDVDAVIKRDQFIALDAENVLSAFLVDGWPNEALFMKTVSALFQRAQVRNRRVRAFGEMVAVLWAQGRFGATVNLEYLWNKFCTTRELSLFCAYPRTGFTTDISQSINGICRCHSKMIDGSRTTFDEVLFRDVV